MNLIQEHWLYPSVHCFFLNAWFFLKIFSNMFWKKWKVYINIIHQYWYFFFAMLCQYIFFWHIDCFVELRQRGRFAGFSLYVSNTGDIQSSSLCYKDWPLLPLNFTTVCAAFGRYVIFYNERLAGVTYPTGFELYNVYTELCEVVVFGKYHISFWNTFIPKNVQYVYNI